MFIETSLKQLYKNHFFEKSEKYECDSIEISIKFLDENNNILGQKTVKKG